MSERIHEDRSLSLELSHGGSFGFLQKEWVTGTIAT